MATNQGCKGIVPSAGLEAAFLFYCLLGMVPQLDAMGSGTTFRELSSGKLKEVRIPVPSLSEQRRIVAILDEAFEGIAAAKVSAGRNLLNSKEVFKARVASLFRERDAEWIDTTLEAIAENLDSKRIPITKGQRQAGDYPYYGASGIIDFVNEYIFEGDCLLVSEDGANLLMRSSPIAFSVSGKYWVNNHAHILRFPDTATQRYVEFYLESIPIDRYVTGAAQPKLTQRAMNSIPVPMPKRLDRRKQIVDRIGHLESLTAAAKKICEAKLSALDELKASLLHQAFSGALVGHHESK
jgi:type I restriction enzyme S subunit